MSGLTGPSGNLAETRNAPLSIKHAGTKLPDLMEAVRNVAGMFHANSTGEIETSLDIAKP